MSLIKCPECGHDVSSKAETCPQCGVKIAGNVKRCPVCQHTLLMDATQCPHCHTRFEVENDVVLEPGAEETPTPADNPVATVVPVVDANDTSDNLPTEEVMLEGEEPKDPKPAAPKKGMPWYLMLFIIVIVALGGYLYWDNYQQRRYSEEKAFELLRECNDPLNFEDFIARYPNSEHLDEVRAMLKELQKEDAVWEVVAQKNDVDELKGFVQSHPHSPFIKVAMHKIDSLDWRTADRIGSSAAYDVYIQEHDAGEYITEAYAARDAARTREDRARRDSIAAAQALADSLQASEVDTLTTD